MRALRLRDLPSTITTGGCDSIGLFMPTTSFDWLKLFKTRGETHHCGIINMMSKCLIVMCLVALASCESMSRTAGKLLRKNARRSSGRVGGVCPKSGPDFQFILNGEHTSPTGTFLSPDSNMPHHRTAGWNDADIAQHWKDASDFYLEYAGVDFTNVPVDPVTGFKHTEDWDIIGFTVFFGLRVPYSSEHGVIECPIEVLDEGLALMPKKEGLMYHGTLGGVEGTPAFLGDINPFGHYFIDFDQDSTAPFDTFHYRASSPMRPDEFGRWFFDCHLFNDKWGAGKSEGRFDFFTVPKEGGGHLSCRAVVSFPNLFDM